MSISNFTWARIDSAPMPTPMGVKPFIAFDLLVPSPQPQWWRGSLDLVVSSPSLGLGDTPIGQLDLLSFPLDALTKVVLPVPANLQTALTGTSTDLRFTF